FVALLLMPYTYPRYVIPLMAPVCWLIGLAWKEGIFQWRLPKLGTHVPKVAVGGFITVVILGAIILWPPHTNAMLRRRPKLKARAAQINQHVTPNDLVYVWNPDFQPYLLYVHAPIRYLHSLSELPPDARYLITSSDGWKSMQEDPRWAASLPEVVQETESYREITTVLLRLKP
ncbi:MAG: hypothetical protein M3032_10590, partial [Verrucomicrobiota bacterium]|nr:hypothetical protein [Verrucomicrobiota bacterium]